MNGQNPQVWFQHSDWHNGYFIAVLEQSSAVEPSPIELHKQFALIRGDQQDNMPMLLHVGCGAPGIEKLPPVFRRQGWQEIRLDIDPDVKPDLVASTTNMHGIPEGAFDAIFSSHNVEHLYPYDVPKALAEMRRVLKRTGFALLLLPDLQEVARHVADGLLEDSLYKSSMGPIAPLDILYGHRPSLARGNLFMAHHTGFTADTLGGALIKAGFEVSADTA